MTYLEKMTDSQGNQVALFPLESFIITQRDDESYSHDPAHYWATDYQGFNYTSGSETQIGTGSVVPYAPYYAPVDMECVGMDKTNASICWRSINKVHLANDTIDYLILLFYHDNNVPAGAFVVGQQVAQGEIIGHCGTYGNRGSQVANHVHMESGYGENWLKVYQQPYYGHINLDYALHNYDAMFGNDSTCWGIPSYPDKYPWKEFTPSPTPVGSKKKKGFPWYITAQKRRNKYY